MQEFNFFKNLLRLSCVNIWFILKMRTIIFLSLIYISHMSDIYVIPEKSDSCG